MTDMPSKESSMVPPKEPESQESHLSVASAEIEDALLQLINLNSDNILHEPTCMICSSPQRSDLEKKWLKNKKHEEVKVLFKTQSSLPLSNDIIDNHMRFHYEMGIKELQKVEYINKIKRLNTVEMTTLDRIRLALSMLTERLMGINSITSSSNISVAEVEKIKSSETSRIMVAFNNLLKLQASIMGEMKNSGELIIIPRQAFIDTFNKSLIEAKTDGEKEVLKKLLKGLAELSQKTQ